MDTEDDPMVSERAVLEEEIKAKTGRFGQTPEWLQEMAFDKSITFGALALYTYLDTYYGGFAKGIFPRQSKIALDMKTTERTIRRWQAELVKVDAVTVFRKKQVRGGNKYILRWHHPDSPYRDSPKPKKA